MFATWLSASPPPLSLTLIYVQDSLVHLYIPQLFMHRLHTIIPCYVNERCLNDLTFNASDYLLPFHCDRKKHVLHACLEKTVVILPTGDVGDPVTHWPCCFSKFEACALLWLTQCPGVRNGHKQFAWLTTEIRLQLSGGSELWFARHVLLRLSRTRHQGWLMRHYSSCIQTAASNLFCQKEL